MSRSYFLSPTAIRHLREHKKWSIERFGRATTKKYFEDLDKGFQYIAGHYKQLPSRFELTGNSGLLIYPVREHYVIFLSLKNGVHIAAILGQAQDIPNILIEHAGIFKREIAEIKNAP